MANDSLRRLQCGLDDIAPRVPLRAGPLTLQFGNGDLWYLRYGDLEVLRRVYAAVRDPGWATIPIALRDLVIADRGDSFRIRFSAVHRERGIHFEWQGEIEGGADGSVVFRMDGAARTTFLRNRIGICVLHPIEECSGKPCEVVHTDGVVEPGVFPGLISPHQPFKNIREIRHQVAPGLQARVAFAGDVFEMEDQRNWTDLSFKTYSTPLEFPIPAEVRDGTRIEQSVSLRLEGSPPARPRAKLEKTLSLLSGQFPMPDIGLGVSSPGLPPDERALKHLGLLRPKHLRVDLRPAAPEMGGRVESATAEAARLGAALEVALFLPPSGAGGLDPALALLDTCPARIARVLLFDHAGLPASPGDLARVRQALGSRRPAPIVGTGAAGNFADLNRSRPAPSGVDFYCYSANPQVHASDNATIVENLRGLGETVDTARSFSGGRPLVVSPLTIRTRRKPGPADPDGPGGPLPPGADPRQISLFGAGWTACSLGYLASADVRSVTYFETVGWPGVLAPSGGVPGMTACGVQPGAVFPLYHVLADFAEHAGGRIVRTRSNDPLSFDGVALACERRLRVIVASWLNEPQTVRIDGVVGRPRVRRLNSGNVVRAMQDPAEFRSAEAPELPGDGSRPAVVLEPYEVVRLDWLME